MIKKIIVDFLSPFKVKIEEKLLSDKVDFLYEKYSESFRKYHNLNHVFSLLKNEEVLKKNSSILNMAILYHDVIYKVGNNDNELKSADIFYKEYSGLVPDSKIKEIYDLILATSKTPWDKLNDLEKTLVDADWFDFTDISLAKYHNYLIKEEVIAAGFTEEQYNQGVYKFFNDICKKYHNIQNDIRLNIINQLKNNLEN